jgi:hypothetical protein
VTALRAGLFAVWLYGGTVLMIVAALPLFLAPRGGVRWAMRQHARYIRFGLRWIVGAPSSSGAWSTRRAGGR